MSGKRETQPPTGYSHGGKPDVRSVNYQTTDTSDDSQSNDEILDRLMDLKSDLTALRQSVNDRLDYIEGNLNDVITAVESQKK